MVDTHNAYRLRHMGFNADGTLRGVARRLARRRALLQVTGAATNYTLAFNASLANAAAAYATKCIAAHDSSELQDRREGENL